MDSLVKNLLENQLKEKIQKPNCKTRSGRSFLAFYLQTKFRQIINHDKKSPKQIILSYRESFLDEFSTRLINRPNDRILIALSGESASGKSTICNQITKCIKDKRNEYEQILPVIDSHDIPFYDKRDGTDSL